MSYTSFIDELEEIHPSVPWDAVGVENVLLLNPWGKNLYHPFSADYLQGSDGTAIMQVRTRVAGNLKEYALTSETFIANLVAYVDEDGEICCFNPGVVNDVLLKSTKAFSEAISQEANKEATKEVTQQSLSVNADHRPSWMP